MSEFSVGVIKGSQRRIIWYLRAFSFFPWLFALLNVFFDFLKSFFCSSHETSWGEECQGHWLVRGGLPTAGPSDFPHHSTLAAALQLQPGLLRCSERGKNIRSRWGKVRGWRWGVGVEIISLSALAGRACSWSWWCHSPTGRSEATQTGQHFRFNDSAAHPMPLKAG